MKISLMLSLAIITISSCKKKNDTSVPSSTKAIDIRDNQLTLSNILPSEGDLPSGIKIKSLPKGEDLPYNINANPYFSKNPKFIEKLSKEFFSKPFAKGEITSALFVVYDDNKELGVCGFDFNTKKKASEATLIIRDVIQDRGNLDRMTIIQKNTLVLMLWSDDNIRNKNFKIFYELIQKKLSIKSKVQH